MTATQIGIAAEVLGFVSALCLTLQTFRLIRHQRGVEELRQSAARRAGSKAAQIAEQGAEVLAKTVGRWDRKDERLVVVGLLGLAASFLLKLIAVLL